jgi:lysozyme
VAQQADLAFAGEVVARHVTVPLTDNQYGALVDFAFNVGIGNFLKSGVLRAVNEGRRDLVPGQLMLWVKAGGKRMPGLVTRRALEANLWTTPDTAAPPVVAETAPAPAAMPDVPSLFARLAAWLRAHA